MHHKICVELCFFSQDESRLILWMYCVFVMEGETLFCSFTLDNALMRVIFLRTKKLHQMYPRVCAHDGLLLLYQPGIITATS